MQGHSQPLEVIILAAGKGTRMRSRLPKVLHPIGGRPMVSHVLARTRELDARSVNLVVGHGAEVIKETLDGHDVHFVDQSEQLGTGHAVQQALPHISADAAVLILCGDVPLIRTETLRSLAELVSDTSMGLLTAELPDPTGYGRIVRNDAGKVTAIVEQKDASDAQKAIREINSGVMAVRGAHLAKWLPTLSNDNAQGEYYLTDIIALAQNDGVEVKALCTHDLEEIAGVNNRQQQAQLERAYQQRQAQALMVQGLTLIDPNRFDLRGSLTVGMDCVIDINCIIEGTVTLGDGVYIGPNSYVKNADIGADTQVHANSIIEDATVADQCAVGPFARLRPGTRLAAGAKIGNFVETKKAHIGVGSKVNHLSYVGDASVGSGVNIGAGTITCNYDGVNKFKTEIEDGVFVGSNTALVAPVKLGKGATVAAGSTVTGDVGAEQLGVARARQRNINGWKRPSKKTEPE
jgi:bifunctional UDP-N-acetylglucosamine pyrophosphorylase/glucosamine-1-phosphate N-acetyltransferase